METTGPKICIVGSGVVGQATGKGLALKGLDVTFIDTDPQKVEYLRSGGYKAFLPSQLVDGQFNFDISFLTVPPQTDNSRTTASNTLKDSSTNRARYSP